MQKPEKIPILFLETSQTFLDLSCGEQGLGFEVPALSMARSVKKPQTVTQTLNPNQKDLQRLDISP